MHLGDHSAYGSSPSRSTLCSAAENIGVENHHKRHPVLLFMQNSQIALDTEVRNENVNIVPEQVHGVSTWPHHPHKFPLAEREQMSGQTRLVLAHNSQGNPESN